MDAEHMVFRELSLETDRQEALWEKKLRPSPDGIGRKDATLSSALVMTDAGS
jgi:hypothetical protein